VPHLKQAIFTWHQDGIVGLSEFEDFKKTIEDLGELFKALVIQSNKLMGEAFGPADFAEGPSSLLWKKILTRWENDLYLLFLDPLFCRSREIL
jgi:hypothetical protein